MKSRPILFQGAMVRALLNGSKTQTRRVVKGKALDTIDFMSNSVDEQDGSTEDLSQGWLDGQLKVWSTDYPEEGSESIHCPYGQPGDQLWVRETFQPTFAPGIEHNDADWETGKGYQVRYTATEERVEWIDGDDKITDRCKPAIHMPRWASRITLEITGVRVERLNDISEADAQTEGIRETAPPLRDFRMEYADLWTSINGDGSWHVNPWVWVVEFKVVKP